MKHKKLSKNEMFVYKLGIPRDIKFAPMGLLGVVNILHIIFPPWNSKKSGYYAIPHSDERHLILKYFHGGTCSVFSHTFGSGVEGIFVDWNGVPSP